MSGLMFRASDFDERMLHKSQNAQLDRVLARRKQPRFAVIFASVRTGETERCTVQVSDGGFAVYDAPVMRREVAGVQDNRTGGFTPVAEIVTALFAAVGLEAA